MSDPNRDHRHHHPKSDPNDRKVTSHNHLLSHFQSYHERVMLRITGEPFPFSLLFPSFVHLCPSCTDPHLTSHSNLAIHFHDAQVHISSIDSFPSYRHVIHFSSPTPTLSRSNRRRADGSSSSSRSVPIQPHSTGTSCLNRSSSVRSFFSPDHKGYED